MKPTEQLSVITDEIGQDIENILPTLKQYEIKAVELRNVWGKNIINFSDEELAKLKELLDQHGIRVSSIAGPLFKCHAPWLPTHKAGTGRFSTDVEASRKALPRAIEIIKRMGAYRTRVFGYLGLPKVSDEHWRVLIDDITRFVDMAKQDKIEIVVENEAFSLVSTWKNTLRILSDIKDPYFKLLLDPGNYFMAGEIHPVEYYDEVVPRVGHHHVKDGAGALLWKHYVVVGEGKLDYPAYFEYWTRKCFNGYYSLETHIHKNRRAQSYVCLDKMHAMLQKCNDLQK
ncbi:MAG: sugar phosphate isomerase/epimerase [Candidatus Lokiarchaeota archaeon]|nr:sugar phosphate isomerase/epimerase [Candidatus Lokiarchaeota archaeon]